MAAIQLITFRNIIDAVREELGIQSGDTVARDRIKRMINLAYLDEVVPFKRWFWLLKNTQLRQNIPYSTDTAVVAQDSTTVTLNTAPDAGLGSFANYYFSPTNFEEIYTISDHTAGSATITLSSAFNGSDSSEVSFQIWTDRIVLPEDCREVVEVWHNRWRDNMEGVGFQEFRRIVTEDPKDQTFPHYFNVSDFADATPLTDETSDDRSRIMRVYPAIQQEPVMLNVDYIQDVDPLDDDADEPVMPIEDRVVLLYAALSRAWASLMRNPEEAKRNFDLMTNKLTRMAGKVEDGFDTPVLKPKPRYLRAQRRSRIGLSSTRRFTHED